MNRKTILVCEDDEGIVDITKIIIKDLGYNVVINDKCDDIVGKVKELHPVLILMDLWMPDLSGEAAGTLLKADPSTKNIPLIFFSASKDVETVTLKVGADGFLKKPFDIEELEALISKYDPQESESGMLLAA